MKKLLLALTAISILSVTGCKKDDDCSLTAASLVGTYKVTAISSKADASAPVVDELATWDACEKDDTYEFTAANTIIQTDAGIVCTPAGGQTTGYTLTGSVLDVVGLGAYTITSFSCNRFTMSENGLTGGEEWTMTFTRQ